MGEIDLAFAHHRAGRLAEAEVLYRQILAQQPENPDALHLFGALAHEQGQHEQAAVLIVEAIKASPGVAQYHNSLGESLFALGRTDQALVAYRTACALDPTYGEAHNNFGIALGTLGRLPEAISAFEQARRAAPHSVEACFNLANALHESGKIEEAIVCYREALALAPEDPEIHSNLGVALKDLNRLSEAVVAFEQALVHAPNLAPAHGNLGAVHLAQAQHEAGIASMRKATALEPNPEAHSNLIQAMHYDPRFGPAVIFDEARRWQSIHAAPLAAKHQPHDNDRRPDRRLRIGYVSPDFRSHSVAYFIEALLAHHDRSKIEVYCYANLKRPDVITEHLRGLADHWQDIIRLSDEQAAQRIREDQIDILVDLAGHTAGNRLLVFARKPAPVQVAYLGYPATRGLAAIDYWITDALADPRGNEQWYVEQVVHLAQGFNCYAPISESLPVQPLPALRSGHLTFGSFNNVTKLNEQVIALWAKLLAAVPDSRLLLKGRALTDRETCERLASQFAEQGIGAERLEFIGWLPESTSHLTLYERIDVALDPFPYNGHTTTCEALWMGVPVITLAGQAHAGRVGVSLLNQVGLPELVAQTPEHYVALAMELASDLERLRVLRQTLRERLQRSPLMDAQGFTRRLEAAYRGMWEHYCKASGK